MKAWRLIFLLTIYNSITVAQEVKIFGKVLSPVGAAMFAGLKLLLKPYNHTLDTHSTPLVAGYAGTKDATKIEMQFASIYGVARFGNEWNGAIIEKSK